MKGAAKTLPACSALTMRFPTMSFCTPASSEGRRISKDAPSDCGGARPCYRRRKGSHQLKGGWKGANFLDVPSEFYRLMQPMSQSHRPFERATALHIASRSVRGPTA